ncbi:MAG TPA: thiamine-phosphate kinase [Blastocatellia bacterium]|nr:thiamine-phosphate kinase [Blastocatellia bacterium]
MPREGEIISFLRRRSNRAAGLLTGIGDDAAVFEVGPGKQLIACCDLLIEGVHFRSPWSRLMGRKALAVNLSDVAAMSGVPRYALLSIAFPAGASDGFVQSLLETLQGGLDLYGVSLIGGDTSRSPGPMFIDVSVIGACEGWRAVLRGGARPGDAIYVSGSLGGSALGLMLLDRRVQEQRFSEQTEIDDLIGIARLSKAISDELDSSDEELAQGIEQSLRKHLVPEPRLELGAALGREGLATSMIDISDGLSTDLGHLADESGCGAAIRAGSIPIAPCALQSRLSVEFNIEPLQLALHGGEEYELLFTVRPSDEDRLSEVARKCGIAVTRIGDIVGGNELTLVMDGSVEILERKGYEHDLSAEF